MPETLPDRETRRPGPRVLLTRTRLPMASGKASAWILFACFVLAGLLIPVAAHLPRWIEFEMVLAAYWLVWLVAMTALLYQGRPVADDAAAPDWNRRKLGDMGGWLEAPGCGDLGGGCAEVGGESCLSSLAIVGILIALLLAAWLLIEFVIPAIAFLLYWLIRGMLSRAVNDKRDCQGHLLRSLSWGAFWATLYTAPLALLVWALHLGLRHGA